MFSHCIKAMLGEIFWSNEMADIVSPEKRSQIMAAIKSKGNKATEMKLAGMFRQNKIVGWRRNFQLFGNPDFAFPSTVGAESL